MTTAVDTQVIYAAPSECPRRADFIEEMRGRSARVRVVDADAGATGSTIHVRIELRDGRFSGHVILRGEGDVQTERSVSGDRCADVVSSLAFVAVLALDPETESPGEAKEAAGRDAPVDSHASTSANGGPETASANAPSSPKSSERAVDAEVEAARETRRDRDDDRGRGRASSSPEPTGIEVLSAGGGARVVSGSTPDTIVSYTGFVETGRSLVPRVGLVARLRFEYGSDSSAGVDPSASFVWTVGSLELCPTFAGTRTLRFDACARATLGALSASGDNVEPARYADRLWTDLGPVVRARLSVASTFFVELEGAAAVPLVRDRFVVNARTLVFQPPWLGWGAGLGAGFVLLR